MDTDESERLIETLESLCNKANIRQRDELISANKVLTEDSVIKNLTEIYDEILYDLEEKRVSPGDVEESLRHLSKKLSYINDLFKGVIKDKDYIENLEKAYHKSGFIIGIALNLRDDDTVDAMIKAYDAIPRETASTAVPVLSNCKLRTPEVAKRVAKFVNDFASDINYIHKLQMLGFEVPEKTPEDVAISIYDKAYEIASKGHQLSHFVDKVRKLASENYQELSKIKPIIEKYNSRPSKK